MKLYTKIEDQINKLNTETFSIERKETLLPLIEFIHTKVNTKQKIRINFICTHNSRRSHLSQIWAQALAFHLI